MQIAVLGTGRVGGALGSRWANRGHKVIYGCRDPEHAEVRAVLEKSGPHAVAASVRDAALACPVVLLAVPWSAARDVLASIGPLGNRVLLDCINPLKHDLSGLDLAPGVSAAELIASWAPGTRVVKAFNTVGDAAMVDPWFGDQRAAMFYCGDDAEAKAVTSQLTADLDLEPVDAGPLRNACYLESLAMLYIHLAVFGGWGAQCAFKVIKR